MTATTEPSHTTSKPILPDRSATATKGLLLSADPSLIRAFERELRSCEDCPVSFDVHSSADAGTGPYACITIDLDAVGMAPLQAVQTVRAYWPSAQIAVLSFWWSEREHAAREQADIIIHKPLRHAELQTFLRLIEPASEELRKEPPAVAV